MEDPAQHAQFDRFDLKPSVETHFSWVRTRLSVERTLMSWVRTATALIGFGFSIVQFFMRLKRGEVESHLRFPEAPGIFGLALILAGVVALAISIREYRAMLRYLWSPSLKAVAGIGPERVTTPLLGVAIVLVFIGALVALSVVVNIF